MSNNQERQRVQPQINSIRAFRSHSPCIPDGYREMPPMSGNEEESPQLNGIRAFIDFVAEQAEAVASGRRIMFGNGRLSSRQDTHVNRH